METLLFLLAVFALITLAIYLPPKSLSERMAEALPHLTRAAKCSRAVAERELALQHASEEAAATGRATWALRRSEAKYEQTVEACRRVRAKANPRLRAVGDELARLAAQQQDPDTRDGFLALSRAFYFAAASGSHSAARQVAPRAPETQEVSQLLNGTPDRQALLAFTRLLRELG